jgi:hypothetical protein
MKKKKKKERKTIGRKQGSRPFLIMLFSKKKKKKKKKKLILYGPKEVTQLGFHEKEHLIDQNLFFYFFSLAQIKSYFISHLFVYLCSL